MSKMVDGGLLLNSDDTLSPVLDVPLSATGKQAAMDEIYEIADDNPFMDIEQDEDEGGRTKLFLVPSQGVPYTQVLEHFAQQAATRGVDRQAEVEELMETLMERTLELQRSSVYVQEAGPIWHTLEPCPLPVPRASRLAEADAAVRIDRLLDPEIERNMATWELADAVLEDAIDDIAHELLDPLSWSSSAL